jgi:asparagine synthase (glutamine-hydrolysing)
MCGIVGIFSQSEPSENNELGLRQMLAMIRHRGPDGFGIYLDEQVGMGSARLSIIDIAGGDQPISNEDGSVWIVFNGEIFNYVELRPELEKRGHHFSTQSDTEVIVHLYEDYGPGCLRYLNGQFAIAIWDRRNRQLFLARDRVGIRPLFYAWHNGQLIFGSEIKTILTYPGIQAEIDPVSLDQIFTFWSTLSPRTVYRDIFELPPGHYMLVGETQNVIEAYWSLDFSQPTGPRLPVQEYQDELEDLLVNATQIRLRADVPVGAYLSGGLDSSTTTAIIRNYTDTYLDTFSIAFSDPDFDESAWQRQMADFLGTQHQVVYARHEDIGRIFPNVIWHTETPILRTSPAPLYLLSSLVHDNHYKVVLTGEGADEFFAGYDIYKEAQIRRFWARRPESSLRPLLFQRLYPDISNMPNSAAYLASFFGIDLTRTEMPEYSHNIRWRTTSRTKRFFSDALRQELAGKHASPGDSVDDPQGFATWDPLSQAQYLESSIFLPQYLLSSQGDRVAMAHSVEGRFPFLDYRVVEFCCKLPPDLRMLGLTEKYLLRRLASKWLPQNIWNRPKRPYRAPIHRSFFNQVDTSDYVRILLSKVSLNQSGLFNPETVHHMVQKLDAGKRLGETDDMALAGILSTQLVWQQFVNDFQAHVPEPIRPSEITRVCTGNKTITGVYHGLSS